MKDTKLGKSEYKKCFILNFIVSQNRKSSSSFSEGALAKESFCMFRGWM